MNTRRLPFSLLCFLIAVGCSTSERDSKMLIGKYYYNQVSYSDSIFINDDHTYKHKFRSFDGQIFESVGKWEYDSIGKEILFKDFVFFNNDGPDSVPPGNWFSEVIMLDNGEVRLMYSSEDNIYYSKNPKPN